MSGGEGSPRCPVSEIRVFTRISSKKMKTGSVHRVRVAHCRDFFEHGSIACGFHRLHVEAVTRRDLLSLADVFQHLADVSRRRDGDRQGVVELRVVPVEGIALGVR